MRHAPAAADMKASRPYVYTAIALFNLFNAALVVHSTIGKVACILGAVCAAALATIYSLKKPKT